MKISLVTSVIFITMLLGSASSKAMEQDENNDIDRLVVAFQNHNKEKCNQLFHTIIRQLDAKDHYDKVAYYVHLIEQCAPKNHEITNLFCQNLTLLCTHLDSQGNDGKRISPLVAWALDILIKTENCDALSTLAVLFAHDRDSTDYKKIDLAIQELLKKKNIITFQPTNQTQKEPNEKSNNQEVIAAFADLIDQKVNSVSYEKPKNLLDAIVRLKWLCTNIGNVQLYSPDDATVILAKGIGLGFKRKGMFLLDREMPSHAVFQYYFDQAITKVFKQNKKIDDLTQIIVQHIAKIRPHNKEKLVTLLEKNLPDTVTNKIKKLFVKKYGWKYKYDLATNKIPHAVGAIKLLSYDSAIVTCSPTGNSGLISIWNTDTLQTTDYVIQESCSTFKVHNEMLAVAVEDSYTIELYDKNDKEPKKLFTGHVEQVNALAFIDDTTLVSASHDGTIKVWDISSKQLVKELKFPSYMLTSLLIVDNKIVVLAIPKFDSDLIKPDTRKPSIFVIELENFNLLYSHELNSISRLIPLTKKKFAALSEITSAIPKTVTVNIFHASTGKLLSTLENIPKSPAYLYLKNGFVVASDNHIKIYDKKTGKCTKTISLGRHEKITNLKKINSSIMASESFENNATDDVEYKLPHVKMWDISAGKSLQTFDFSFDRQPTLVTTNNALAIDDEESITIIQIPSFENILTIAAETNLPILKNYWKKAWNLLW